MSNSQSAETRKVSAFSIYLRTGRRVARPHVEVKFNPWHDPENGRFTFVNSGSYYADGYSGTSNSRHAEKTDFRQRTDAAVSQESNDPKSPRNYSLYAVRPGDTLTHIASLRKGLTARDIAWLNDMSLDQTLKIGQSIKIPNQRFLDDGKHALEKFKALEFYMESHDSRLPQNPAEPPSILQQIADSPTKRVVVNNYAFDLDFLLRMKELSGEVQDGPIAPRSRQMQLQAGGEYRRPTDHGGHYIASRFNGPAVIFNHFAQDAKFNLGAYAKMENQWKAAKREGKKVWFDIKPEYSEISLRPSKIIVLYTIDGVLRKKEFSNEFSK